MAALDTNILIYAMQADERLYGRQWHPLRDFHQGQSQRPVERILLRPIQFHLERRTIIRCFPAEQLGQVDRQRGREVLQGR